MSSAVKVAVRVRPFNKREIALGAQCCIKMDHQRTTIVDLEKDNSEKTFSFDYSFWSHDGYKTDPATEKTIPDSPKSAYADQDFVFEALGQEILNNAWEGFHCCLFAYGQTGSGKSYSMVGYGKDRGIIPIICEEIFRRISANTDKKKKFEVYCSMLEIYNECVYDLMLAKRDAKGLEIRESTIDGVYVKDLTKYPVASYEEIDKLIQRGTSNRSIGATQMNATSSRAHTVVMIRFEQVTQMDNGREARRTSVINLVDLAGSEKANQTEATGDRLKEGCNINKSLSALGNVIKALAEKAEGKKSSAIVPYRDSKLTRLLQNALGGSSKTIMICSLSPASTNYEETLSTLRYAERAKTIRNRAVVNEDAGDKKLRELMEENEKLKLLLQNGGDASMMEEKKRLEEMISDMNKTWETKLNEAKNAKDISSTSAGSNSQTPHIFNLNEDTLLSGKLVYSLPLATGEKFVIGKKATSGNPSIVLHGLGVVENQCVITFKGKNQYFIESLNGDTSFLNGLQLKKNQSQQLKQGDRLVFGASYGTAFLVYLPHTDYIDNAGLIGNKGDIVSSPTPEDFAREITFEEARKEVIEGMGEMKGRDFTEERKEREDYERRLKEAEDGRRKAEEEGKRIIEEKEQEIQERLKGMKGDERLKIEQEGEAQKSKLSNAITKVMAEAIKKKKNIEREERNRREKEMKIAMLDETLQKILPQVKEANLIAQALHLPYSLATRLLVQRNKDPSIDTSVVIPVKYKDTELFSWSPETLDSRLFIMRDLYQRWLEMDNDNERNAFIRDLAPLENPYWDPIKDEKMIGTALVHLEPLSLLFDVTTEGAIYGEDALEKGKLKVEIIPCNEKGEALKEEDTLEIEEGSQLEGKRVDYLVKVVSASGLPVDLATDVYVKYKWFGEEESVTKKVNSVSPRFDFLRQVTVKVFTKRFLEYLEDGGGLVFEVWGRDARATKIKKEMESGDKSKFVQGVSNQMVQMPGQLGGNVAFGQSVQTVTTATGGCCTIM